MTLQLARLAESVNRIFDEKRLTGAVFLDVAEAIDTLWVKGLLYKFTIPNSPPYSVKTTSLYLHSRTFQTPFQSATCTRRSKRSGVVQDGLVSLVLFSLCVNDTPSPSRHELALYADDTAIVATSRRSSLLVSYLEAYLSRLEHWLRDWRIATNATESNAVLFAKSARRIQLPRPVQFFGESKQWAETIRYIGVTLDNQLTCSAHVNQVRREASQRLGVLGPHLNSRSGLSIRNGVLLYKQLIRPMMDYVCSM
jgi:hypothetical protein